VRKLRLLVKLKLSKRLVVPVRREHRVPARLAVLHISSGRTQYGAFDRPSENFGSTITFRVFFTHHLYRGERARDARVLVVVVPYQLPQPIARSALAASGFQMSSFGIRDVGCGVWGLDLGILGVKLRVWL